MLYDYFFSFLFTIEGRNITSCIIYPNTSTSTYWDTIYKCQGSSNEDGPEDDGPEEEEESFDIEEELAHLKKLRSLLKKAIELDQKLPESQKGKNAHLKEISEDPHVKDYFDGKTPNIGDLLELDEALFDSEEEKRKELKEAQDYSNNESSTNSLKDPSNSRFNESDNTLNKKEDDNNYSEYKLGNSLLEHIIDILKNIFS